MEHTTQPGMTTPDPRDSYISTNTFNTFDLEVEKGKNVTATVRSIDFDEDLSRPVSSAIDIEKNSGDGTGSPDLELPINWSGGKKAFHMLFPSLMSLVTTLISSAYVTGVEPMMVDFHVSLEVGLVSYVLYMVGLGVGTIFWGPCSEVYGRKIVYIVSLPLCGLFVMGTGFSQNIATAMICRFLSGMFGIGPVSAAPGTITDMYSREQVGLPTALFVLTPFLGPAIGPVMASYVIPWKNWRWICWIELIFVAAVYFPIFLTSETNKLVVLARHAKKAGLPPPPSPTTGKSTNEIIQHYLDITVFVPLRMLATESVVLCFSIWTAFNFALLYSFFAAFEWVWLVYYDFSEHAIGLTFLGIAAGCLLGLVILIAITVLHTKPYLAKHTNSDDVAPEFRLYPAMLGSIFLPASLFLFAWTTYHHVHWAVPVAAEALFACGNFIVFMSVVVYFSDVYTPHGFVASALAANTLLRYVLASAFPLFSLQMFENLKVQWAGTLLGFVSLALAVVPFLFCWYGPALRRRSAYSSGKAS